MAEKTKKSKTITHARLFNLELSDLEREKLAVIAESRGRGTPLAVAVRWMIAETWEKLQKAQAENGKKGRAPEQDGLSYEPLD